MTPATITALRCRVLRISDKTDWTFVELACSDDVSGVGEASINGAGPLLRAHTDDLARRLVGQPALPNAIHAVAALRDGGRQQRAVVSAIEQALWDAQGHRLGVPVTALLGGALRSRIPAYANINRRTRDRTPDGFAASARAARAAGFTHVKLAPFDGVDSAGRLTQDARVAHGIACIAAACDAMGGGAQVLVDCHWRFDETTAFRILDFAAEQGLFWLECPVPEDRAHFPVLRRLRDQASRRGLRLAGLETGLDPAEFKPHVDGGHYDVLMPDVKYTGGLGPTRAIAELAATAGQYVAPHNPSGPICHAASLAIAAVLPNFLTLEVQFDESRYFEDLVGRPLAASGGSLPLPDGPGLGVTLDPALMRELESDA